jgi:serine/threonine-protein kinase HipA
VPTRNDDVQWLSDEEVVAMLDELPRRPMLAGKDGLRLSLAGAQDKLPVVFDGARIGLPLKCMPSSHILKPSIHAIEDSVINEGFCMALAGHAAQASEIKSSPCLGSHVLAG